MTNEKDQNIEEVEVVVIEEINSEKTVNSAQRKQQVSSAIELLSHRLYVGRVAAVHNNTDGKFCFIKNIRQGFTTVNTNGDVFCPNGDVRQGDMVEFDELKTDPERQGKFRTDNIQVIGNTSLMSLSKSETVQLITKMTEPNPVYHYGAKQVDPMLKAKVAANMPFAELLKQFVNMVNDEEFTSIHEKISKFFRMSFASLIPVGVNFTIDEPVDLNNEMQIVNNSIESYKSVDMPGMVTAIKEEYEQFKGVREVFRLMNNNNLLHFDTIIPLDLLPEIFMASPVWYVAAKGNLQDLTRENDPQPDHAIEFFCDSVGSTEFAWAYQMYNRRTRSIKMFSGKDIIPPQLIPILQEAKIAFDYTVIATPYHDVASTEWADPKWLRNIDPFLLGFKKGLPFIFVLGRWSGTGIFPLFTDMVADTINHIKLYKDRLNNFKANTYWYKGENGGCLEMTSNNDGQNRVLLPFANKMIKAFDEGWLFEFLKGKPKP